MGIVHIKIRAYQVLRSSNQWSDVIFNSILSDDCWYVEVYVGWGRHVCLRLMITYVITWFFHISIQEIKATLASQSVILKGIEYDECQTVNLKGHIFVGRMLSQCLKTFQIVSKISLRAKRASIWIFAPK